MSTSGFQPSLPLSVWIQYKYNYIHPSLSVGFNFVPSYSTVETNYNVIIGMVDLLVMSYFCRWLSYMVDLSYSFCDLSALLFEVSYFICGRSGDRIPVGAKFSPRPDRPCGPSSLLYKGYRVFSGGKVRPGRAADHSSPSSAEVLKE